MTSISQFLGDDHRRCDDLFLAAERAIAVHDREHAAQYFQSFRQATEFHLAMEEQVLFTEFEAVTGGPGGPTFVMRMEHDRMRGLFMDMARALAGGEIDDCLGLFETLLVLMQQHNLKEEQVFYPMCERALPDMSDEMIVRMRRVSPASAAA